MKYKNTKTGVVIDVDSAINGGDWVKLDISKEKHVKKEEKPAENPVEKVKKPEQETGVTKKQIMQELDAMGIKYDPKAKKDELYNLMIKG